MIPQDILKKSTTGQLWMNYATLSDQMDSGLAENADAHLQEIWTELFTRGEVKTPEPKFENDMLGDWLNEFDGNNE